MTRAPRLAILASHPVQYYAPIFRRLANSLDLHVYYSLEPTPGQQAAAGFDHAFEWDIDLLSGYSSSFLDNVSPRPGTGSFSGCNTPAIYRHLAEGGFTSALTLGWHLKSLLQGVWGAKRLGLPVLVRGDSQLTTPRAALLKLAKRVTYPFLLRTFDAALYVGSLNRDYFRHYGYPAGRLFHSPHCVETERFAAGATDTARAALRSRLGIPVEETVLLFAGKLIALKQPHRIVEAAGALRRSGRRVSMMVAGSGPMQKEISEAAARLQVPLHALGFQNQTQMPAAYAASDILVLPSTEETWGLVCNEALASGRPIIVSDQVGCAPDLANDNSVGRTFRTGDSHSLAAAIADAIDAPPGRDAIRAVSERYSVSAACAGIEEALDACRPATPARTPLGVST